MTVGLKEMCEGLGLKIQKVAVNLGQSSGPGCIIRVSIESGIHPSEEEAQRYIEPMVEALMCKVIAANRNLTNEDLGEIMLKIAQLNLMNDLNKLKEKQNE